MSAPRSNGLAPTSEELAEIFRMRHGAVETTGWQPRMRRRFDYFTPDEVYEATVAKLVTPGCAWLDVGCGRSLFPSNPQLADALAARCGHLTGVDPDATIDENPFVHERVRAPFDEFEPQRAYDLVTLRMVAEHVADPETVVAKVRAALGPGGRAVVYTVNLWSPVPLLTSCVPFALHQPIKKFVWRTDERDTFPTLFRMNTRSKLRRLFESVDMREELFEHLDDCRSLAVLSKATSWLELAAWRALRSVGLRYPETCLLGVYRA